MSAWYVVGPISSVYKTYPKSSTSLYPHYSDTRPSRHHHPSSFLSTLASNPLSQRSQGDDFETAHQFMLLLCLKSPYELSSMAFRIKSQIIIPGLQRPSPSGLPPTPFPHPPNCQLTHLSLL